MSSVLQSPIGPATAGKRGTQSAAHFTKLEDLPANATLEARLLAIESAEHDPVSGGGNGLTFGAGQVATLAAAGAGQAGAVTAGAQEIDGPKTFLASLTAAVEAVTALVRAVGVSLVLRSSLGAGASDKCVVVGSSDTTGNNHASAKQFSAGTGVGGTYTETFGVTKAGAQVTGTLTATTVTAGSGGISSASGNVTTIGVGGTGVQGFVNLFGQYSNVAGAKAIRIGNTIALTTPGAELLSFYSDNFVTKVAAVNYNGEFEHAVAGAGIILKSPDGTRYRLSVANGGTLVIGAA